MDPALGLLLTTYSLTLRHINRRKKLLQEYLVFKRNRRKRKAVFVVVFSADLGTGILTGRPSCLLFSCMANAQDCAKVELISTRHISCTSCAITHFSELVRVVMLQCDLCRSINAFTSSRTFHKMCSAQVTHFEA